MKNWNPETILRLLRESGEIALRYAENPPQELKADSSAVTCADREIEAHLALEFDRPGAGRYLLGEETIDSRPETYLADALRNAAYIVDPIDGTAPYTAGFPVWSISIGLAEQGVLSEGAIYQPVPDRALYSEKGRVFQATGLRTPSPKIEPFLFRGLPYNSAVPLCIPQRMAKYGQTNVPNQVFVWSACVATLDAVMRGKVHAALVYCKLWDLAGSWPLLHALGVNFRFTDGSAFSPDLVHGNAFRMARGPRRWGVRTYALAAPSQEDAERLLPCFLLPEPRPKEG